MKALFGVFAGLFVAIIWSAIGYAVSKTKGEAFDPHKFAKTLLIGIIISSLAVATGVNIETLEGMSVVGVATIVVDKLAGLLFRKA